jgi:hypothetical protein
MTLARINARLDAEVAEKLEALRRRTGRSTTEIICVALERLYESEIRGPTDAASILRKTGFIGSGTGSEDLSTDYKSILSKSLGQKTR